MNPAKENIWNLPQRAGTQVWRETELKVVCRVSRETSIQNVNGINELVKDSIRDAAS